MTSSDICALDSGYTAEVDSISERAWFELLEEFDDANIYQTWPYAAVIGGRRNISHLVLRQHGKVVGLAQARVRKIPLVNAGIAYVHWGPLWRHRGTPVDINRFRQTIRALRNEFICNRGLGLRLFPLLFDEDQPAFLKILAEEGFTSLGEASRSRTILMDLNPQLNDLHDGMAPHWKRELKAANKFARHNGMETIGGTDLELFDAFIRIYKEMVSRKNFIEPNNIDQFRAIQEQLPEKFKMRVMLYKSGAVIHAGAVCSVIGDMALYLFGATSNAGMKSNGSYVLHWKFIEEIKAQNIGSYNLNGINPEKNPGTYKFKNDLGGKNGKDVYFLGRFDYSAGVLNSLCVEFGEKLRMASRTWKEIASTGRRTLSWLKPTTRIG